MDGLTARATAEPTCNRAARGDLPLGQEYARVETFFDCTAWAQRKTKVLAKNAQNLCTRILGSPTPILCANCAGAPPHKFRTISAHFRMPPHIFRTNFLGSVGNALRTSFAQFSRADGLLSKSALCTGNECLNCHPDMSSTTSSPMATTADPPADRACTVRTEMITIQIPDRFKNEIVSVIFAKLIPLGIPRCNCNQRAFPRNCYISRESIRLGITKCNCNCNLQNSPKQKELHVIVLMTRAHHNLEGPTRKPRHASVFSTHSDTQAVPAFHAFLKRTDTLSTIA